MTLKIEESQSSDEDSEEIEDGNDDSINGDEAALSDEELEVDEPQGEMEKMEYWVNRHFKHYEQDLLPDHVRAAYLLCPRPEVMAHAKDKNNYDPADRRACERLLRKIMVNPNITDAAERQKEEAIVIDTFYSELSDFQHHMGVFERPHIWIIAKDKNLVTHTWHEKYTLHETKVFGRFACIVTSKKKGISCAERHWKQTKFHKKGRRGALGTMKTKKLSTISTSYSYEQARLRADDARTAGHLWEDEDFFDYNNFCERKLIGVERVTRVFRAWEETWEKEQFSAAGDEVFAAKLSAKYEGLKWQDPDSKRMMRTLDGDCVVLCKLDKDTARKREKGKGWGYMILGVYENYNESMSRIDNDARGGLKSNDFFEMHGDVSDFYYMVIKWYKENPEPGLRVCEQGECESVCSFHDDNEEHEIDWDEDEPVVEAAVGGGRRRGDREE